MKFSNKNLRGNSSFKIPEKSKLSDYQKAVITAGTSASSQHAAMRILNKDKNAPVLRAGLNVEFILPDNSKGKGRIAKVLDDNEHVLIASDTSATYKIPNHRVVISNENMRDLVKSAFVQQKFKIANQLSYDGKTGYYYATITSFYTPNDRDIMRYASHEFEGFDVVDAVTKGNVITLVMEKSAKKVNEELTDVVTKVLNSLSQLNPGLKFELTASPSISDSKIVANYTVHSDEDDLLYVRNGKFTKAASANVAKGKIEINEDGYNASILGAPFHMYGLLHEKDAEYETSDGSMGTMGDNDEYREDHIRGSKDDPCWSDYKQVGMKEKGGKQVPNCVPKKEGEEDPDSDPNEVKPPKDTDTDKHFTYDALDQYAENTYDTYLKDSPNFANAITDDTRKAIYAAVIKNASKYQEDIRALNGNMHKFAGIVAVNSLVKVATKQASPENAVDEEAAEYLKKYLGELGEYYAKVNSNFRRYARKAFKKDGYKITERELDALMFTVNARNSRKAFKKSAQIFGRKPRGEVSSLGNDELATTALEQSRFFRTTEDLVDKGILNYIRKNPDRLRVLLDGLGDDVKYDTLVSAFASDSKFKTNMQREVDRNLSEQESGYRKTWSDAPERALDWIRDLGKSEERRDTRKNLRQEEVRDSMAKYNRKYHERKKQVQEEMDLIRQQYRNAPPGSAEQRALYDELNSLQRRKTELDNEFRREVQDIKSRTDRPQSEPSRPEPSFDSEPDLDEEPDLGPELDEEPSEPEEEANLSIIDILRKEFMNLDIEGILKPYMDAGHFSGLNRVEQFNKAFGILRRYQMGDYTPPSSESTDEDVTEEPLNEGPDIVIEDPVEYPSSEPDINIEDPVEESETPPSEPEPDPEPEVPPSEPDVAPEPEAPPAVEPEPDPEPPAAEPEAPPAPEVPKRKRGRPVSNTEKAKAKNENSERLGAMYEEIASRLSVDPSNKQQMKGILRSLNHWATKNSKYKDSAGNNGLNQNSPEAVSLIGPAMDEWLRSEAGKSFLDKKGLSVTSGPAPSPSVDPDVQPKDEAPPKVEEVLEEDPKPAPEPEPKKETPKKEPEADEASKADEMLKRIEETAKNLKQRGKQ